MLPGKLATQLLGFVTLASFPGSAAAASTQGFQTTDQPVRRCGNVDPPQELVDAHQMLAKYKEQHQTRANNITKVIDIDLYMHVVMNDPSKQALANDTVLNMQMATLNDAFKPSKFHFNLKNVTRHHDALWGQDIDSSDMRFVLRQGDQKTLNVFILQKLEGNNLGAASYPHSWGRNGLDQDYVNIVVTTLPGSVNRYNGGITLVHEVGHWLGLFHPHHFGCDQGDLIDDTPAMASADYSCTVGLDTCVEAKHPGKDPIHNYMGYGPDYCLTQFTPDQTRRMHDLWATFRLSKNEKELSWKADCEAAFETVLDDCLKDKTNSRDRCQLEHATNKHLPCSQPAPRTEQECLDRFAPYKTKCRSDSCKVDFTSSYEKRCAAAQRVEENPSSDGS